MEWPPADAFIKLPGEAGRGGEERREVCLGGCGCASLEGGKAKKEVGVSRMGQDMGGLGVGCISQFINTDKCCPATIKKSLLYGVFCFLEWLNGCHLLRVPSCTKTDVFDKLYEPPPPSWFYTIMLQISLKDC